MSSKCSVLRNITDLLQKVDDLLGKHKCHSSRRTQRLIDQLRSLRGAIQALPINRKRKKDILDRVSQAIHILRRGNVNNITTVLAVSQILLTVRAKVEDLMIPCPQGLVTVHPSNCFNTVCECCQ